MLMLMLVLWLQAVTPGVTHGAAYHRPSDGNFYGKRRLKFSHLSPYLHVQCVQIRPSYEFSHWKRKKDPTWVLRLKVKLWNRGWVSIWWQQKVGLPSTMQLRVGTMHNIWNVTSHNIGRTLDTLHTLDTLCTVCTVCTLVTLCTHWRKFHWKLSTACFTLFTAQCKVSEVTKAEAHSLTIGAGAQHQ